MLEWTQVIEELIQWAKEMQKDAEILDKLNLSVDEIAFYRALIENEKSVRQLGDNNLRSLAIEFTRQLRKSAQLTGKSEIVFEPECVTLYADYCVDGNTHQMQQKRLLNWYLNRLKY